MTVIDLCRRSGIPVTLADGTHLVLRPIVPDDKSKLRQGMGVLSAAARRHRFFSSKESLDEPTLIYLTEIDYRSHVAWVAVDVDRLGQPVVAVARYIALGAGGAPGGATGAVGAEVAFVVGDDYQRHGIATMLLELLTIVARDNGIEQFHARVLDDNVAMRRILTRAGGQFVVDEAGVLRTAMDLPPLTGRFDSDAVCSLARAAADGAYRRSA